MPRVPEVEPVTSLDQVPDFALGEEGQDEEFQYWRSHFPVPKLLRKLVPWSPIERLADRVIRGLRYDHVSGSLYGLTLAHSQTGFHTYIIPLYEMTREALVAEGAADVWSLWWVAGVEEPEKLPPGVSWNWQDRDVSEYVFDSQLATPLEERGGRHRDEAVSQLEREFGAYIGDTTTHYDRWQIRLECFWMALARELQDRLTSVPLEPQWAYQFTVTDDFLVVAYEPDSMEIERALAAARA